MIQIFLGLSLLFISPGFALSEPSHLNRNAMAGTPAKNADSGADPYKKLFVNILAKDTGIGISKLIKPGATLQRVSDIGADKTYRYQITGDGSLTNRQLFVAKGSDGMTLDNQGNLYISGDGVTVYDPKGRLIGHIYVPSKWVGNICFGGRDGNILFITASESIYTLQMRVKRAR